MPDLPAEDQVALVMLMAWKDAGQSEKDLFLGRLSKLLASTELNPPSPNGDDSLFEFLSHVSTPSLLARTATYVDSEAFAICPMACTYEHVQNLRHYTPWRKIFLTHLRLFLYWAEILYSALLFYFRWRRVYDLILRWLMGIHTADEFTLCKRNAGE